MIVVVGAGLAGLAAAVALTEAGQAVRVLEAAPRAGGRCRSYDDPEVGCVVDNGNHLLLSGNRAAMRFLDTVGARGRLGGPGVPMFPFADVATGERWTLRPSAGRLPVWVTRAGRRVPGTRVLDYVGLARVAWARGGTVDAALPAGPLRTRLMEPLAVSTLNTQPSEAHAPLLAAVMRETLMRGGAACVPMVPRQSLADALVEPAVAWLRAHGGSVETGRRVLAVAPGRLTTADGPVEAAHVVLAVPPWVAAELLPELRTPDRFEAIVNLHFRGEANPGGNVAAAGFVGLVGGLAEWAFVKPGHVSVTISAANRLADMPAHELAARVWDEIAPVLGLPTAMPAHRVLREKRATFAATAAQEALRPGVAEAPDGVVLAGDWTATGLPATIEGAIRSGFRAAAAIPRAQGATSRAA